MEHLIKKINILTALILLHNFCWGQECWSLDKGWIPCSTTDTLIEKSTGKQYIIYRNELCIKAFDQKGSLLWETNPWENQAIRNMKEVRWNSENAPLLKLEIVTIDFPKSEYMGGQLDIVVYFSERVVGSINKRTGKFNYLGRN